MWRPSNTRCSYTSSVTTNRSASMQTLAMHASSAASNTFPVGLCGELSKSRRVRRGDGHGKLLDVEVP